MLVFFDSDTKKGTASIYENHITFNKSFLKYMNEAYKVRVGFDQENKKILVFLINKDYALSGEIKESSLLSISVSKTYARVCSKPLIEHICEFFELEIPEKSCLRFDASFDEVKKAIVIDMEVAK